MGRTDEGREELGGALNQALEKGRRAVSLHPWAVVALALTLAVMVSFHLVQVFPSLAPVVVGAPFRIYLHGNSPLALALILLFVHSTRAAAFQQDRKFLEAVCVMMGILLRGVASRTRPRGEMQMLEHVEPVSLGRSSS